MPRYEVVNAEGVVLGRAEVADGPGGTESAQDLLVAIAAKWSLPRVSLWVREVKDAQVH